MVIPVTLVLFCLLILEDIVQDITVQIKVCWKFLNSAHLYINKKATLATALLLMRLRFGIICLMRSYLFKKVFPIEQTLYPASSWYRTWQWLWIDDFLIGFWCCTLQSAWQRLSAIKVQNRIDMESVIVSILIRSAKCFLNFQDIFSLVNC